MPRGARGLRRGMPYGQEKAGAVPAVTDVKAAIMSEA